MQYSMPAIQSWRNNGNDLTASFDFSANVSILLVS